MSIAQSILPEFEQEMANTRKVLERVPEDKLEWKAHAKSNTIGWNAAHLANLPSWTVFTLNQDSLDIHPPGSEPYRTPPATSRKVVLENFDQNVADAKKVIAATSDADFMKPWSLLKGGQTIMTMPKIAVLRSFIINHIIHHRAILTVYLRLNDVPVPGLYGPSGDEQ
jgi:uncharacterized damage-inducible protein DinB